MYHQDGPLPAPPKAARMTLYRFIFHWIARYRGPVELGWYDFTTVFRRSFLGPLWAPIQLALWITMLTLLLGNSFSDDIGAYAIYVALGFFAWDYISWSFQEGPKHLSSQGQLLQSLPIDLSMITVRKVAYLSIRSLFQLPVPILALILFSDTYLSWHIFLLLPVAIIYAVNAFSFLTIFGMIGVYFRDFEFLMPTVARLLFFTTPIFWVGDTGFRKILSTYNPLSYFIELVRAPLDSAMPSPVAFYVVGIVTLAGFSIALWMQSRFRYQVIYRI